MNCPNCHSEVQPGWNACPACGKKLQQEKVCANCGKNMDASWVVCPFCETREKEAQGPSVEIQDSVVKEFHQVQQIDSRSAGGASVGGNIIVNLPGGTRNQVVQAEWVECPVCGRKNKEGDVFTCRNCGQPNICLKHLDESENICVECIKKKKERKKGAAKRDAKGRTPLFGAVRENDIEKMRELLEIGADVNAKDNIGFTPLHVWAFTSAEKSIGEMLLQHGADVNAKSERGLSPLHGWALKSAEETIGEVLLQHGAEPNAKSNIGNTPLHMWVQKSAEKSIGEMLLQHGADVNAKNEDGLSPLHIWAVESAEKSIGELLLQHGADVNAKDEDGYTPLHGWALKNKEKSIADLLLKYGANPNAKSNDGLTPRKISSYL